MVGKLFRESLLGAQSTVQSVFTASPLVRISHSLCVVPGKRDGKIISRADTHCSALLSDLNKAAEQPLSGRIRFLNFCCLEVSNMI